MMYRCSFYPKRKRYSEGFTLIELLIVILIMGISFSIVGGLTVESSSKFKLKSDKSKIVSLINYGKKLAFISEMELTVIAQEQSMFLMNARDQKVHGIDFEVLSVPQQRFLINRYGEFSVSALNYTFKGDIYTLVFKE